MLGGLCLCSEGIKFTVTTRQLNWFLRSLDERTFEVGGQVLGIEQWCYLSLDNSRLMPRLCGSARESGLP